MPPNTSSSDNGDTDDTKAAEQGPDARALVDRLAEEFGADPGVLCEVGALYENARARTPDIFVPAPAGIAAALAGFDAVGDPQSVYNALAEWALDAEAEPIERMRRDCLRFQDAMTRGALRLYADEPERCTASLNALQRFIFLQIALLASLAVRSQTEGGVVRTLPTPDYAAFMEIFRTTIEAHKAEGKTLGLLVLNVGRIEQVDRLLGLQKGEAFMLRVTRRMREGVLRKHDLLGRISRNELACLLPRIAGEGVAILDANKILDALQAPIPLGDRTFAVDAAIGAALYPDHGTDQQTLVRNGKLAASVAREETERIALYDSAQGASEEHVIQLETRLRHALELGTLAVKFAPQLDLASGRLAGFECVLAWTDEELGEVSPARAQVAAEAAGLSRELTWWLYNNALRLGAELAQGGIDLPLSLTATASVLAQADFAEFIDRALDTWKVDAARVLIEIDETALGGDVEPLKTTLAQLKARGVRLAIGGFGTTSFSLVNLSQLPLDEAKIGAAFAADMLQTPVHAKIIRSLVHLAKDLELGIMAEGVDDAATAEALAKLGCTRIQGAHVGCALSVPELLDCGLTAQGPVTLPLTPRR